MKNILILFILALAVSCTSVKRYNQKQEVPISVLELHQDINFTQKKLQLLHPNLYWFISKENLNFKFDSLKSSIKQPLKPREFYQKLAPIIADIKEGHLRLYGPEKKLTRKEIRDLKKQKGLLGRFNYVVADNQIYVKDNADKIENMPVGTELLEVNGVEISTLLKKYQPLVNSDGYNTTFQKYSLARRWANFFTEEYGILDSVKIKAKYQGESKSFYLHREKITKEERKKKEIQDKKISKSEKGKTKDYNVLTKSFNRDLQFPTQDSTVAYMKIKTFSGTYSGKFYKQSFSTLKVSPAKYLIIDVRDNLGGSLAEINNLYSYLVDKKFKFINDIEVTSRFSMFQANYFNEFPTLAKPLAVFAYPFYLIGTALSVKKEEGKFYMRNNNLFSLRQPKKNNFKGKIYLLINGSSFSASALIASKLKADQRAILVGEETGGANDGTVAGRYSTKKLPNSKLKLPIGLMFIQPNIQFTNTKKGVLPDIEITPTLTDILQKKDIQLELIFNEIEIEQSL